MNTLDLLLFQNDGECDLLDDDNFNINGSTRNQSIMNDENSFISSKATPLATFNSNDKVKPRGLRVNDSSRNINSNSPIPGLNKAQTKDNKVKGNIVGVRFNENIKVDTINNKNKDNISIFSPEGTFSDHLTRLAGHTPFVDNNTSNSDEGRKYVDMHNFNYETKWSPLDSNSPNVSSNIKQTAPSSIDDNIITNNANKFNTSTSTPSFLITNNNGYNFNDSIDIDPKINIDSINGYSPSQNESIIPSSTIIQSNPSPTYQHFKSISADALTSSISPTSVSPTIVHYLEQDEIKKQEDSPQISQRMSFRKDSPIVAHHVLNQNLTPRSLSRSSSAPPTRGISNFNNNSFCSNSPRNASNISPYQEHAQANGHRVYYDDIVCSPYDPGYIDHYKACQSDHTMKRTVDIPCNPNLEKIANHNNFEIIKVSSTFNNCSDNEDTGVSRMRPGLGLRKSNFNHTKPKHESITNIPKPVSNPNPPSAIKVVNPSVSGPDKKQNPFSSKVFHQSRTAATTTTHDKNAITENLFVDENNAIATNNINDFNLNDVSIQCPSVRDGDTNTNNDSINFDDNSSYGDNDEKAGLEALISPNPNPIKSLLSKIPSSNTNLGTASRVLKSGCSSTKDKLKSSVKQDFDVRAIDLNVTFSEDNLSINESVFEPIFATTTRNEDMDNVVSSSSSSTDLNNSVAMTCVTTLTLDSFDGVEGSFDISPKSKSKTNIDRKTGPRLNITSKRVRKNDFEDMKEVTMLTVPGEFTTIMLEFGNKKNSKQTILSKATCMRFDPTHKNDMNNDSFNINEVFQVSPHMLDIPLNSHKAIYLTFAPNSCIEGIYTGVLKIKNNKKSFVLLLRGEARYPVAVQRNSVVKNNENIENNLNNKVYGDYDFEISDDENNKNSDDDDEPLLGLELDLGLARPPDYTKFSDLLSETNSKPYYHSITDNNNIQDNIKNKNSHDWFNTRTRLDENSYSNFQQTATNYNNTATSTYTSNHNEFNGLYPKSNDIAEKVANDLLKVRQKVIKDWLGKENNKKKEIRNVVATPATISSLGSYSNIFSVMSKNSSSYQPTPNNVTNNAIQTASKASSKITPYGHNNFDFGMNSKSNTTASSKQTMYTTKGLKSNNLVDTSSNDNITTPSIGLFFRRQCITFGPVAVGTLARLKVELCNGSDNDISVLIGDPSLPFVLLHNEVHVKARSYVRIPIRFVPVFHNPSGYTAELIAQSIDGQAISKINLAGNTFY